MCEHPFLFWGRGRAWGFIAATGLLLLCACNPKYYIPNSHNIPLLHEKGEGTLSLADGDGQGTELQAAYAITNNTALMLNTASFKDAGDPSGDGGKGGLLELGLGHYRSLSEQAVFETYVLVGGGDMENHFPSTRANNPSTTGKIESKLIRYGFQSAVGFKSKVIDIALSTRITRLNYSDISGSLLFSGVDQIEYLKQRRNHWLFEPALTLRIGYDPLKLQLQVSESENLSHSDFRQDEIQFTAGVVYRFKR